MQGFVFIALGLALVAAYTDTKSGLIPNWLTLPALVVAPLLHGTWAYLQGGAGGVLSAVAWSLLGAVVCSLVPLLLFVKRAIGGGDVKLLMAMGALALPTMGIEMEFYGFIIAALYALLAMSLRGQLGRTLKRSLWILRGKLVLAEPAPSSPVMAEQQPESGAAATGSPEAGLTWLRLGPSIFLGSLLALLPRVW